MQNAVIKLPTKICQPGVAGPLPSVVAEKERFAPFWRALVNSIPTLPMLSMSSGFSRTACLTETLSRRLRTTLWSGAIEGFMRLDVQNWSVEHGSPKLIGVPLVYSNGLQAVPLSRLLH
jgi:hypothetical protein